MNKKIYYICIAVIIFSAGIYAFSSNSPQDRRKELIEKLFDPRTGENYELTSFVKMHLQAPGTYKNEETNYWDNDSVIIVNQKYTAENAAGERFTGFIKAAVNEKGEIRSILDQRP